MPSKQVNFQLILCLMIIMLKKRRQQDSNLRGFPQQISSLSPQPLGHSDYINTYKPKPPKSNFAYIIYTQNNKQKSKTQYYNLHPQAYLNQGPEKSFLRNFQTLKDLLIEENYTNIKNLSLSNQNFNEVFSYLKGILRKVMFNNQSLKHRIGQLQQALSQIDPKNPLLSMKQNIQPNNIGEAGHKLINFVPSIPKIAENITQKFIIPSTFDQKKTVTTYRKGKNNISVKQQCSQIKIFVWQHLQKSIIYDPSRKLQLPKDIIVNLYLRWVKMNNFREHVNKLPLLKSFITNQIKRLYPNIEISQRFYRGIAFIEDITRGLDVKIEDKPPENKKNQPQMNNDQTEAGNQPLNDEQDLIFDFQ